MKKAYYYLLAAFGLGATAVLAKNKVVKRVSSTGLVAALIKALQEIYKEEKAKTETQCQETEKAIKESGLNPSVVDTTDLLENEGEQEIHFGEIFLREVINSNVFPDEALEYNPNDRLGTLHVLQNEEKNRVIISIPLPKKTKWEMSPRDIREFFQGFFEEFIGSNKLDMKPFMDQVGVYVGLDKTDGYTYFFDMLKEDGENFKEYLERITDIIEAWESGERKKYIHYYDGLETLRFEQYLNIEFPVFPRHSRKRGLDLVLAMKLFKSLMDTFEINVSSTGRKETFEFRQIIFHSSDDYGFYYQVEGNKILEKSL